MALTVGGNGDSLAGLAAVDAVLSVNRHVAATWEAFDQAEQENLIRLATLALELDYRGKLKGKKADPAQKRLFPRSNLTDEEGNLLDEDTVPQGVDVAVAYYVIPLMGDADLTQDDETRNLSRLRVEGAVDLHFRKGAGQGGPPRMSARAMSPFVRIGVPIPPPSAETEKLFSSDNFPVDRGKS
ncbi:MAG TPA: DnaT-like ssDNA-binding protein [Acidobacteriota bacterium]|nr:DnaT-like ssDNA-binding protein [Acidobacteriota bacterium]